MGGCDLIPDFALNPKLENHAAPEAYHPVGGFFHLDAYAGISGMIEGFERVTERAEIKRTGRCDFDHTPDPAGQVRIRSDLGTFIEGEFHG
jgi:hypothetical protein